MKRITGTIFILTCCCFLFSLAPIGAVAMGNSGSPDAEKSDPPATIEVIDFNGQLSNENNISLFCKIKSNCCYNIVVERSGNGKRFSPIATASDNKPEAELMLHDNDPLRTTNYYRLKMVDHKGNISYSKTMVVQLYRSDDLSMVSVTPNTTLKDLHINVQLKNRAYIVMKVTDREGREIISRRGKGNEGTNLFELEGTGNMAPGNYLLEVVVNSRDLLSMPLVKKG